MQTRNLLRTEEHHFIDLIRSENLVSMLVTPVIFEDVPIGLITHYTDQPHRFHDDERMIARALADLGAIADLKMPGLLAYLDLRKALKVKG